MGFRLERSAAIHENTSPSDADKRFRMGIYLRDTSDSTEPLRHFGEVYGDTRAICSMRAELVCLAVNKGADK